VSDEQTIVSRASKRKDDDVACLHPQSRHLGRLRLQGQRVLTFQTLETLVDFLLGEEERRPKDEL